MVKKILNKVLATLGYKMSRLTKEEFGLNMEHDMKKIFRLIEPQKTPIIFDVGANVGQSVTKFKGYSANAEIHTFEPSLETYKTLVNNTKQYNKVVHNNFGLGAEKKEVKFYANQLDDISSFLEPTSLLWGETKKTEVLKVYTLDHYCEQQNISKINILKIDTQGYDLEVLKGGKRMLQEKRIDIIQMEITLEELYHDMPRMDEVLKFIFDLEYSLVAFYGYHNKAIAARWTDAIFISSAFADNT